MSPLNVDRSGFTVAARLTLAEGDLRRHEARLEKADRRVDKLESRMDVLATKVGVYATLGAAVGGAAMSGILFALLH